MARTLTMSDSIRLTQTDAIGRDGPGPAFFWTLAVRAVIFFMGVLSILTTIGPAMSDGATGHAWVAYDGSWYVHLIQHGYPADRAAQYFYVIAFFPVLPLLAKPLAAMMSPFAALVVVANVCSMIGFGFLYSWVRDLSKSARVAFVATLIVATYPGAVFFSGALTEGPFFMFVAMTLWLLQRQRLFMAAAVCALATLTRPTGVALAATVALYALVHLSHLPIFKRLAMTTLLGLLSGAGGLAYEAFLWHRYGTPDAYMQAQAYWERGDVEGLAKQQAAGAPERYSFEFFRQKALTPQAWNRGIAIGLLAVIIVGLIKPGPIPRVLFALPIIIFLMTALPNHGLRSSSIFRYESAGLPIFALLAVWLAGSRRRGLLYSLLSAQFALQLYYAVLFSRGIWVG